MSDTEEGHRKQKSKRRSSGQNRNQVDHDEDQPQLQPTVAAPSTVHPLTISPDLSFPWRLYIMLSNTADDGFESIVSWTNNGTAFQVYDTEKFESKVLPKYFKMTKYNSFTRQLYAYGFSWQKSGPAKGGYYQPIFSKNNPSACYNMERAKDRRGSRKRERTENIRRSSVDKTGNNVEKKDHFERKLPPRARGGAISDGISSNNGGGNGDTELSTTSVTGAGAAGNVSDAPTRSQQSLGAVSSSSTNRLFNPGVASRLSPPAMNFPEQQNSVYSVRQGGYIEQTDAATQNSNAVQRIYGMEASMVSLSDITASVAENELQLAAAQVEGNRHGALLQEGGEVNTTDGYGGSTSHHSIDSASTASQVASRRSVSSETTSHRQRRAFGFPFDELEPRSIEDMVEEPVPPASTNANTNNDTNRTRPPGDCHYHGGAGI